MNKCAACIKLVMGSVIILAIAGCSAETNPISRLKETGSVGNCTITILETHFWRDWMPIVQHPGPDGGSPLYAKIQFRLDNSSGQFTNLSFSTTLYDQENRTYPIVFQVLPDQPNQFWDGILEAGDNKVVEIWTHDGPYLPVGSKITVIVDFVDQDKNTVSVRTPKIEIERTE